MFGGHHVGFQRGGVEARVRPRESLRLPLVLDVLNERKALIQGFYPGREKSPAAQVKPFVYVVINKMFLVYETEKKKI